MGGSTAGGALGVFIAANLGKFAGGGRGTLPDAVRPIFKSKHINEMPLKKNKRKNDLLNRGTTAIPLLCLCVMRKCRPLAAFKRCFVLRGALF